MEDRGCSRPESAATLACYTANACARFTATVRAILGLAVAVAAARTFMSSEQATPEECRSNDCNDWTCGVVLKVRAMLDLYRQIWIVTGRAQIVLIILSVLIASLAAVPLQLQKVIINGLAGTMEQKTLLLLGAAYLGVLVLGNALKFALRYKSSILSEHVIRRIRKSVYGHRSEKQDRGTLAVMISAEAEDVGRFAGSAIASPLIQLGTLVTVIAYVAANQPYLGLLMVFVVVPQALIAISVQQRINHRISYRVRVLRQATNRIATDDVKRAGDGVLHDFDEIYGARRKIILFKFSSKFALNVISALGTVGILVLGGSLVINGRTDIGIVVAAMSGLARVAEPWRELLEFYRDLSSVRIKYELLRSAQPNQAGHS
jgi:ABC-type bacteriocin/lantibiotic exporter with double-glycine peptidase domain